MQAKQTCRTCLSPYQQEAEDDTAYAIEKRCMGRRSSTTEEARLLTGGKGRGGEGRGGEGRGGRGRGGEGREGKGRGGKGREGKGREGKGREGKGREGKGREGKGREGKGREGKGREGKGREGKGREGKGNQAAAVWQNSSTVTATSFIIRSFTSLSSAHSVIRSCICLFNEHAVTALDWPSANVSTNPTACIEQAPCASGAL